MDAALKSQLFRRIPPYDRQSDRSDPIFIALPLELVRKQRYLSQAGFGSFRSKTQAIALVLGRKNNTTTCTATTNTNIIKMTNDTKSTVRLELHAQQLKNVAGAFKGVSGTLLLQPS